MLQHDLIQEDANSRKTALDLDSFIIEAPAGAGKTELLTQRYLKLLQTVQSPEEIIAITFTNKAASEMRVRIMDGLEKAASKQVPETSHKKITYALSQQALARSDSLNWQLLQTPSRLRIYTIDSLCGNLARQMPLLTRFGSQPGVAEDANLLYQEAATKAITYMDHPQHGPIVQQALRYFDNDQFRLTDLLVSMLGKREQWLNFAQSKHSNLALIHLIESELNDICTILPVRLQQLLMPIARYAASNLTADLSIHSLLDWKTPLVAKIEDLSSWQALADLLLTNDGSLRKRINKNIGLPATVEAKPFKESLTSLMNELAQTSDTETKLKRLRLLPNPSQHNEAQSAIIHALIHLLNIAVAELWLAFQAKNQVDFVEVSQRALQALRDTDGLNTELAMRLDYRIQHLLVDEFQDTSPIQIKLLEALTDGWQNNDGRTLFLVGDPMQSIYRFRKANVGLFLQVAQQGIGNIKLKPLKLWRNNRSCTPVVDWINQTFAQLFPKNDNPNQGAIQYRPFVATKSNIENAGVTIHPILNQSISDEQEDELIDIRQLEAKRIIEIIRQTQQQRPKANIAVLVRARKHLLSLVSEMRRNHPELNFQAVEIEELANRQIVQDLLTLTYALHQRADRVHWLALLRAPWCGLTLADLHALVANDSINTITSLMEDEERITKLSANGQTRLRHVRQVMNQALAFRGRTTTSRWVHNTWLLLGGANCLWDMNDVQDVQAFFSRIDALELNNQFSPHLLAEDVKKLYAAPNAKADERLQFMTIHKSKGLEFDTVILPCLEGKKGPQDQALMLWEEVLIGNETALVAAPYVPKNQQSTSQQPTSYDYLNSLEKMRSEYEDARVLYVATTRTERHLHLLGAISLDKNNQPKVGKGSFLSMLWPCISHAFTPDNWITHEPNQQNNNVAKLAAFVPKLIRVKNAKTPDFFENDTLQNATNHTRKLNQASGNDNHSIEIDIGILTHLYLQLIATQGLAIWQRHHQQKLNAIKPAMERWFKQKGNSADDCVKASAIVRDLLKTTLESSDGLWILQNHQDAANELSIESVDNHLEVSKKVIDRTFIADNVRWIIDYKTTMIETDLNAQDLKIIAQQFAPQLNIYASLFLNDKLAIRKGVFFVRLGKLIIID